MLDPRFTLFCKFTSVEASWRQPENCRSPSLRSATTLRRWSRELHVTIFDRRNGKSRFDRAKAKKSSNAQRKCRGLYQNLRQDLRDSKKLVSHLTIGVTHTAESNPIAEALANYGAQNDHIMIKMITGYYKKSL